MLAALSRLGLYGGLRFIVRVDRHVQFELILEGVPSHPLVRGNVHILIEVGIDDGLSPDVRRNVRILIEAGIDDGLSLDVRRNQLLGLLFESPRVCGGFCFPGPSGWSGSPLARSSVQLID